MSPFGLLILSKLFLKTARAFYFNHRRSICWPNNCVKVKVPPHYIIFILLPQFIFNHKKFHDKPFTKYPTRIEWRTNGILRVDPTLIRFVFFSNFFAVTDLFIQAFGEFRWRGGLLRPVRGLVRKRGGFGAGLSNTWAKYCGHRQE